MKKTTLGTICLSVLTLLLGYDGQAVDYSTVTESEIIVSGELKQQREIIIRGQVSDENTGEPLPGVNVYIQGTTTGTISGQDGRFELTIEDPNVIIVFSFIGYETRTIEYDGIPFLNVTLKSGSQLLEETVVVGFGRQKKISVTGSLTTVNPDILKTSSSQLSNSFAGRMAGVVSVQRSGEPGSNNSEFWIRGISTFGVNNTPLVFLDGVEIHSGGDLNSIDPAIIESFTVLKDASSTALYGARGANGVILITTKNGIISDEPIVSVNLQTSVNTPTKLPEFTDAVTYMRMANEAVYNSNPNAPQKYSKEQIDGTLNSLDPYLFPNVNWMEELFRQYSHKQYANLNIRGGSKAVQYFSSVSYTNSTGLIRAPENTDNNIGFNRLNIQNNLTTHLSKSTQLQINVNTNFEARKGPNTNVNDLFGSIMYANPVQFPKTFPAKDDDRHIRFGAKPGGYWGVFPNPYANLQSGYFEGKTSTLLALAKLSQKITLIKGLSFEAMVSVKTWSSANTHRWYDPFYYRVDPTSIVKSGPDEYEYEVALIGEGGNTSLQFGSNDDGNTSILIQPQINYSRLFGEHDLQALLVYHQKDYRINDPGNFLGSLPYRNQGFSARISYMFDSKYMIETNIGYTGSENFALGNRFGLFPSISAGYAISNEDFFQNSVGDMIPLLKIRASYGMTGNDQIGYGRFPYLSDVNLSEGLLSYPFGENFNSLRNGVLIRSYGNENVSWEESRKSNIGVDIEMRNGLNISADYFEELRTGILMQRRVIPSFIGIGEADPYANIGEVANKGIDISLNYNKALRHDFIVQGIGTFTFSRNKILAIDEPPGYAEKYPNLSEVGRPVGQIFGLRADYIFSSKEEIEVSPEQQFGNYTIGDIKYLNVNEDGIVNNNDRVPLGYPVVPEITYGFGLTVKYMKFDASVFIQGVARTSFMLTDIHPFTTEFERNVLTFIAEDYWSEENQNPNAAFPRVTEEFNQNNTIASSWWLRDGSFIRLKDIEIGYKINQYFRIYIMGQNLITVSKFDLWDPEIASNNGLRYPTQKSTTLGLQFNF
jgi:TonB-linked SusC/RagA family outer membrane protein